MRKRVVLLVDDEASVRADVKAILHKEGFQTIEAGNGIEAFNLVLEFGRDLAFLLTDMKMPRLDGVSLAVSVRELFPRMPVLFITASDDNPLDRPVKRCGVVEKPFLPHALSAPPRDCAAPVGLKVHQ